MFNSGLASVNALSIPSITSVTQCSTNSIWTLNVGSNVCDGGTTILFEQETASGSGVYTQVSSSSLSSPVATYSAGSYFVVPLNYRCRLRRNGYTSGYSTPFLASGVVLSVCNPPANVSIIAGPKLQFDDTNIIEFPAFHITDNLGGSFGGTVPYGSLANQINLTLGATHANIYMTLRCFTSTTVSV